MLSKSLLSLLSKVRYLRLSAFPTDTEQGRASERYRLMALGTAATAASRLAAMVLLVLTVRWVAPVLGVERFGVWATFSGLAAMLSFLDLGIGNTLINQVAHAAAKETPGLLSTVIMGGIGWLVVLGVGAGLVLALVGYFIPWAAVLKLSGAAVAYETRNAAVIFGFLFGLNLVSGGLLKILTGQQRAYEAQIIIMASTLIATPVVWCVMRLHGNIGTLLIAGFGLQSLVALITVTAILRYRGLLRLRIIRDSMRSQRTALLATGSLFLILQVAMMAGWGGDTLLVATITGASDVAIFAVAQRLFQFASQPVGIVNGSLVPAYADAFVRNDSAFLHTTLQRGLFLSTSLGGGLALVLLLFGPIIIPHWTKDAIQVPWTLLAAYAAWTTFDAAGTAMGVYLVGVGKVRVQASIVLCFCAIALPAKILSGFRWGATGVLLAGVVSYMFISAPLYARVYRGVAR